MTKQLTKDLILVKRYTIGCDTLHLMFTTIHILGDLPAQYVRRRIARWRSRGNKVSVVDREPDTSVS